MSDSDSDKSLDILGIKPVADAIGTVTETSVHGAAAFLRLICRPAAEEFGLMLQDNVRFWRTANIVRMTQKAQAKFGIVGVPEEFRAHPRLVSKIVNEASWVDDDELQEMWAGLLVSSCSPDGTKDGNMFFVESLSRLTKVQARILNCACTKSNKYIGQQGIVAARTLRITLPKLCEVAEERDINRLDQDLDQLHTYGLIVGGFATGFAAYDDRKYGIQITPTGLALNMYVRCQGSPLSLAEYFKLTPNDKWDNVFDLVE